MKSDAQREMSPKHTPKEKYSFSKNLCIGKTSAARLAQSVEHETLNLRVVGSSPTLGVMFKLLNSLRGDIRIKM